MRLFPIAVLPWAVTFLTSTSRRTTTTRQRPLTGGVIKATTTSTQHRSGRCSRRRHCMVAVPTSADAAAMAPAVVVDDKILTPYNTEKTKFNYGPASHRDNIVVTCERPGCDISSSAGYNNSKIPVVASLESWLPYIQDTKGVQHVLILFDANEMDHYDSNLIEAYETVGLTVHWVPLSVPFSYGRIMSILTECYNKSERIVVHCTHGQGRSGRVAAGWLVHHYQLSVTDATLETLACATAYGVSRLGSPVELAKWQNR